MKRVRQMRVRCGMTVGQLVSEMDACGVLGAGRLAKATSIMTEMFRDPTFTVFLTMAGPIIPGGLRRIVGDLLDKEYVDVLVASGANIVHDIVESLGYSGVQGSFWADDTVLREKGIGRAGDVYFTQDGFNRLEEEIYQVFDDLSAKDSRQLSIHELLWKIGKRLDDDDSVLTKASKHRVPVFSPGLLDSMLGLHLWTYNQLKKFEIDSIADLNHLAQIVLDAEQVGVIVLGGGLPKHHVLGVNILREGVDAAIQITLDRPEGGSYSGAPLVESVSWKKAKASSKLATVIADATIAFPIMVATTLEVLEQSE